MPGPHDKIIANAAKKVLQPLGLRRKGQSRTWLYDHGWWLTVVEFQPHGFRKGSFLNVSAHWLWTDNGFISFDFGSNPDWGSRVAEFEEYVSDEQFEPVAYRLAVGASHEAQKLAACFPSIHATAEVLLRREAALPEQGRGSWSTYHAGVAAGLAGRGSDADAMLRSVTSDPARSAAERFIRLLPNPQQFKNEAANLVTSQRQALRLPELDTQPF